MRLQRFILPLFILFVSPSGFAASSADGGFANGRQDQGREMKRHLFKLYAHRGGRGLWPENSMPAYERAIKIPGVNFVDMDVVMTRDKGLVVYHDLALNPDTTRGSDGRWVKPGLWINQMTWDELQQYDVGRLNPSSVYASYFPHQTPIDGTRIPGLRQVIRYVKEQGGDHIGFQIEIKDDPDHPEHGCSPGEIAEALAGILMEEGVAESGRTEVQAFNYRYLQALQAINPRIATAYLTDVDSKKQMNDPDPLIAGKWTGGYLLKDFGTTARMIKALGGSVWGPQDLEVTPDNVREAHAEGLRVVTWAVPPAPGHDVDMQLTEELIEMGVDGIITDRPDLVSVRHNN